MAIQLAQQATSHFHVCRTGQERAGNHLSSQGALLRDLNRQPDALAGIECSSFFCRWDLMVCPGWRAVLPLGRCEEIPVWTHQQLISHPDAIRRLCSSLRA